MQDKETKLIEKLIDDKAFLTKFSENKSLEEQLKFLKENGFNFSEVEFKDFIKSLEEAYVSSENMSEEDLENVSGGKMQMRSKIAAAALVFGAIGAGSIMGQASAMFGVGSHGQDTGQIPQATVAAQPSAVSSVPQVAQSQNDYVAKFKEAKANGTLIKFVQEIEEEYNRLTAIKNTAMSPEKKKELEERLKSIRKVRMFRDYITEKSKLESIKQSAASSSAPGVTRADAKTPDSKTSTQAGQVSSQPYSPYGNAQLVTGASSQATQAPAVPDRIVAPSASTKSSDETLDDLKKELERLAKEIESYKTSSPDLEKVGDLSDEEKGAIQADYVSQLGSLEKQYKETAALIRKMEQERKNESKQMVKRQTEEQERSVSTTSMAAAAAAPVAVTTDQSELRAAEIAAAKLLSLKSKILVLNKQKNDISGTYKLLLETAGDHESAILAKDQVTEVEGLIQAARKEIEEIELNLRETGQLDLVSSMEAQHSGIQNLGGTCYLNTALQVLTQESAKDTVTGKSFKEEILELTQEQKAGCPVLCALSDFFTAYDKERVDGSNLVSRGTMQKIFYVLKNIKGPDGINKRIVGQDESDESDTTEALGKIIEECINECRGKSELETLKGTIERLFNVVSNQDYVNEKSESKLIAGTAKINFDEFFHDGMVNEVTSKNIVIPFNRSSSSGSGRYEYKNVEFREGSLRSAQKYVGTVINEQEFLNKYGQGKAKNWGELIDLCNGTSLGKDTKDAMLKEILEKVFNYLGNPPEIEFDDATYVKQRGQVKKKVPVQGRNIKVKNPIEIREYIRVNSRNYRLKAISIHDGSTGGGGHYYAYIRSNINPDVWLCHNDENVCRNFGYPIKSNDSADNNGGPKMGEEIADTGSLIEDPYVQQNATNLVYELVKE